MNIREIEERDIPALFAVRVTTHENRLTREELTALGITEESVGDRLRGTFRGWLCEEDEQVVGFAMGDRASGEMWVIAVLPAYLGRGIGSALLRRVEDWLQASGCARLWLTTDVDTRLKAYAFYCRHGWREDRVEKGLLYMVKDFSAKGRGGTPIRPKTEPSTGRIRLAEMTWPDVASALERGFTTVVVAVGSSEQHGPHLPTMTDTRIGDELAHRVAAKLGNALQASTITVGCSEHHLALPGTISLKAETLRMVILDYADSLVRGGFKTVVFLPLHGGNFSTVREAVKEAQAAHPGVAVIGVTDLFKLMDCLSSASAEFGVTAAESGGHAGESETSIMLFLERSLVIDDRFAQGYIGPIREREFEIVCKRGIRALSENGVLGDPTKASVDKGETYLDRLTEFLLQEIRSRSR